MIKNVLNRYGDSGKKGNDLHPIGYNNLYVGKCVRSIHVARILAIVSCEGPLKRM